MPRCPKCGRFIGKSRNKNYSYECNFCDEDFYSFEVKYGRGQR